MEIAAAQKVKHLGENPQVVAVIAGGTRVAITVPAQDVALATAPFTGPKASYRGALETA